MRSTRLEGGRTRATQIQDWGKEARVAWEAQIAWRGSTTAAPIGALNMGKNNRYVSGTAKQTYIGKIGVLHHNSVDGDGGAVHAHKHVLHLLVIHERKHKAVLTVSQRGLVQAQDGRYARTYDELGRTRNMPSTRPCATRSFSAPSREQLAKNQGCLRRSVGMTGCAVLLAERGGAPTPAAGILG